MSRSIGRHDVVMVKSTRPSSTADWERDTIGNDGRTWIRLVAHRRDFWLRDRYEEDPLKATTAEVKETEGERSGPSQTSEPSAIPASEDRMPEQESLTMEQMEVQACYENEYSRGLRESPVVPDPSYDVDSLSTREYNKRKTHADNVEKTRKRVVDSLQDKFDGSILQLSVHPSQQPQGRDLLDRGLAAYDSEAAVALRERIAGWDTDDGDKTDLAKRHAELLDMVARGLVGETYTPLFSARPRPGDYTSDLYVPDIVVWIVTAPGSRNAAISGVIRIEAIDDLKPRASDDLAFRVTTCARRTVIAGDLYGFTACGPIFRLFCHDPLSYNASLPCDVSPDNVDREHAVDFVKMVALFCGPLDVLTGHWKPSDHTVLACRDDPDDVSSQPFEITDWKPATGFGDDGLVQAREQLVGKRSTAFAGRGTINGEEKDLVIKLSYLPEDRRHHEQRVLRHIRKFAFEKLLKEGQDESSDLPISPEDAEELRRGYFRLPRYVGTVDFSNYAAGTIAHTNLQTGRAETLYLSGLVTEGRAGKVLAYDASVNHTIDVYADAARCIWASTLCNVYYRDPNQGNIWQHPDDGGMLIDFGNALLQDVPDSPIVSDEDQLADAARSANAYFICLAAIRAGELVERLKTARRAFETEIVKTSIETTDPSQLSRLDETNAYLIGRKRTNVTKAEQNIDQFRHPRFYDDLESLSYCLVHQLGRRAAPPDTDKTNIADQLCLPDKKRTLWKDDALSTLLEVMDLHTYTQVAIQSMVESVQKTDKEFLLRYPSDGSHPSVPSTRTPIDHEGCRNYLRLILELKGSSANTSSTSNVGHDVGQPVLTGSSSRTRSISAVGDAPQPVTKRQKRGQRGI